MSPLVDLHVDLPLQTSLVVVMTSEPSRPTQPFDSGAINSFRAFVARSVDDDRHERGVVTLGADDLPADGILVAIEWSSINYKDALAASASGRVARISPLVIGIDLAGRVIDSDVAWLRPGAPVVAHGYGLGISHHGGYSQYARVPAEWVVPLPAGLTLLEAMMVGTAGYTAALSVIILEERGLRPEEGPVLVTGATGGVGSIAVDILSSRGYEVVASSGKPDADSYLRRIGAVEVIERSELIATSEGKPLATATWAAAIDCVGGATLGAVLPRIRAGGTVAACGNTGGLELHTTVMPFILRAVALQGIDSVQTGIERRRAVWERLGTDLKPRHLVDNSEQITLDEVDSALEAISTGSTKGRKVVDLR